MATADHQTERVDILPALILILGLIYCFYLLRPPILMFWHYDLGMGHDATVIEPDQLSETVQQPGPGQRPTSLPAIKPPSLPSLLQQPANTWKTAPTPDAELNALDAKIEEMTNKERQDVGRNPLQFESQFRDIATEHSWDMLNRDYMGHISPDGVGHAQRVGKQHRRLFGLTRENVASTTSPAEPMSQVATQFVQMWMNSQGHRRNILAADSTHGATGCHQQDKNGQVQRRCTQLFAQIYALAEQDIPDTVTAGQSISVRIRPVAGSPLPTELVQTNLSNGTTSSSIPLRDNSGVAEGQITLNGPPGVYSLNLHVPDLDAAGRRFWVIPGPYVTVQ